MRPCFNCGEQYERESFRCTACGAKRGLAGHGDDELKQESYITLGQGQSPSFAVLQDSIGNRFVNAFQIALELVKDWLTGKLQQYKQVIGSVHRSSPTQIDSNTSLGELYRLHQTARKLKDLPDLAANVPDLEYIGVFFYEDLVRKGLPTDLKTWRASIEKVDDRLFEQIKPYIEELYCRSKALFIGAELRASGVCLFRKWNYCLVAQLQPEERKLIAPFSRQIFERVREILRESVAPTGGIQVTVGQRRAILSGLALVLLMLFVPPWKSSAGSRRGYGLIISPPRGATNIDVSRLFVQGLFVVLLTGGIVFILNNRRT
ncbi:MAG TPA: hypothetical protein VIX17_02250 [Pyrinomonadaceae bacterium]